MHSLTPRQQQVLMFIQARLRTHGVAPSLREIAREFGFRSMTAAADHVRALRRKGALVHHPRMARAHALTPGFALQRPNSIPLLGSIAAGFPASEEPQAGASIQVDLETLGLEDSSNLFAVEVRGESMIVRHILDGDIAILDRSPTPVPGDIVAALIDGECTLKTLVVADEETCLRAENPEFPDLIPTEALTIQGVLVGLIRRFR